MECSAQKVSYETSDVGQPTTHLGESIFWIDSSCSWAMMTLGHVDAYYVRTHLLGPKLPNSVSQKKCMLYVRFLVAEVNALSPR